MYIFLYSVAETSSPYVLQVDSPRHLRPDCQFHPRPSWVETALVKAATPSPEATTIHHDVWHSKHMDYVGLLIQKS